MIMTLFCGNPLSIYLYTQFHEKELVNQKYYMTIFKQIKIVYNYVSYHFFICSIVSNTYFFNVENRNIIKCILNYIFMNHNNEFCIERDKYIIHFIFSYVYLSLQQKFRDLFRSILFCVSYV